MAIEKNKNPETPHLENTKKSTELTKQEKDAQNRRADQLDSGANRRKNSDSPQNVSNPEKRKNNDRQQSTEKATGFKARIAELFNQGKNRSSRSDVSQNRSRQDVKPSSENLNRQSKPLTPKEQRENKYDSGANRKAAKVSERTSPDEAKKLNNAETKTDPKQNDVKNTNKDLTASTDNKDLKKDGTIATPKEKPMTPEERRAWEKQIDQTHNDLMAAHWQAKKEDVSDADKRKFYSAESEAKASGLVKDLNDNINDLDKQIRSLDKNDPENAQKLRELKEDKFNKEEMLENAKLFLDTIKENRCEQAMDDSKARLWDVRDDSRQGKKHELQEDRECIRNNTAVIASLRKDLSETTEAKNDVYAKLNHLVNTYDEDELRGNKYFADLKKQYNELSDKEESYAKKIDALDTYNQRLSEIWGQDKDGKDILPVREDERDKTKVTEEDIASAWDNLSQLQETKIGKGDLTSDKCKEMLDALQNAEREILPALNDQISDLRAQSKAAENYINNNPDNPDKPSMEKFKQELDKELAEKISQHDALTQASTMLRDHLPLEDQNHTAKFIINPDGTSKLVQKWSTTRDKESATGKSQTFLNSFDKVSTDRFDESGNLVSHDFSYRYKALGYASKRKIGGEKINLENSFEAGFGNIGLKWGYDKEKHGFGFHASGKASVFEIKDTAQLNMFNKQVLKASGEATFMGVSAKSELDKGMPTVKISGNDGLSAKGSLSVGKLELVSGEYKAYDHAFSSKFDIPGLIDGKAKENAWSASSEKLRESSVAFGDGIDIFEIKNKNGEIEKSFALGDWKKYFETAEGFTDMADQMYKIADIKANGLLEDVEKDKGIVVLQKKAETADVKTQNSKEDFENSAKAELQNNAETDANAAVAQAAIKTYYNSLSAEEKKDLKKEISDSIKAEVQKTDANIPKTDAKEDAPRNPTEVTETPPPKSWEEIDKKIFITNDGKEMTYKAAVDEILSRADQYMDENGVPKEQRTAILADMKKEMYHQDQMATERGLGDHGIRHIYGNYERSDKFLESSGGTADEKLGCIVAHVYHDHGYMDQDVHSRDASLGGRTGSGGPGTEFVQDSDHDLRSQKYFDEEIRGKFNNVFQNDDTINSISNAIGLHNLPDTEYYTGTRNKNIDEIKYPGEPHVDGKEEIKAHVSGDDRIISCVMLSDKLALTQREKFSDLLKNDPDFVKLTQGMNSFYNMVKNHPELGLYDAETGKLSDSGKQIEASYKKQLCEHIEKSADLDPDVKKAYIHAISTDMGLNSGNFSSRMNFVYVPSDCMKLDADGNTVITVYKIDYGSTNPNLEKEQSRQIKKLCEDLGVQYSDEGLAELKDKGIILNVETKSIDEIKKIEAENGYHNTDLNDANENLEAGDLHFDNLCQKALEVAEVLKGGEITEADFLDLQRKLENDTYVYSDLTNDSQRKAAVQDMLKDYATSEIDRLLTDLWKEEEK